MPVKSVRVCASPKIFFRAGRQLPVGGPFQDRLQAEPSNILMHIESAKTTAGPQKIFRQDALSGRRPSGVRSLISTNAQQLGKNGRANSKNLDQEKFTYWGRRALRSSIGLLLIAGDSYPAKPPVSPVFVGGL